MRKIVYLVIALILSIAIAGCSKSTDTSNYEASIFVTVEKCGIWRVVYDSETMVMYAVSGGGYNYGDFTMLVDKDGNPKIYNGE